MIWRGGRPEAIKSLITAATTAGRVPLFGPGSEKTLMPIVSWVETRLRHASMLEPLPVRFVIACPTIRRTTSGCGRKASVASGAHTENTRASGALPGDERGSAALVN